jgi:hypothetical protein
MINEIENLMGDYALWLKDRTHLRKVDDNWVEVSTPHLDRHNDYLQIFIKREGDRFLMTDDGYVLRDLEMSGCPIDSPKRKELLHQSLNGFGVDMSGDQMVVTAAKSDFPLKKHNLVQAMLAVNDMFHLASPTVFSLFKEDVANWLSQSDIRVVPDIKLTGESKFDHVFDFAIPGSKDVPERILKAINMPSKESAERLVFAWIDTQKVRSAKSQAYAVLNDSFSSPSLQIIDALKSYQIVAMKWSERERFKSALAA